MTSDLTFTNTPADFVVPGLCVYLVVNSDGGPIPWAGVNRDRAYELAANTGALVTRLPVYTNQSPREAP